MASEARERDEANMISRRVLLKTAGVAAGALMWAASPWLKRWAHGADESGPVRPELDGDRQSIDPAAV